MKRERPDEPEITLVSAPQAKASGCPPFGGGGGGGSCRPNYPDGPCRPMQTPCIPDCTPGCLPSSLPSDCGPTRGEPRPPRPPGPN